MDFRYLVYMEMSKEFMESIQWNHDSCPHLLAGFKEFYDAADFIRSKKQKGFVFYIKDYTTFKKYYLSDLRSK